jgi:tripartite-type tricarboxylate transporter receptor subunit TctC
MKLLSIITAAALTCAAVAPAAAQGQAYPSKPIKIIVPFEAGGTSDTTARILANQLDKQMGTRIIVENRAGANGAIGAGMVARSPADGYTLLHTTPAFVINHYVQKNLTYDTFKDFVPVTNAGLGTGYLVVVSPKLPVKNLQEFIAYAKKRQNEQKELSFASPGVGNALHLAVEMFNAEAGLKMLHIPYKGTSPALTAVASGDVDLMILPPTIAHPFVQSNRVQALAFTSTTRSPDFPTVPTVKEAGLPGLEISGTWLGWFAPAGTPPDVVQKIAAEVRKALAAPEVQAAYAKGGFKTDGRPPAEFATFVQGESQRLGKVLKNIKMDTQ